MLNLEALFDFDMDPEMKHFWVDNGSKSWGICDKGTWLLSILQRLGYIVPDEFIQAYNECISDARDSPCKPYMIYSAEYSLAKNIRTIYRVMPELPKANVPDPCDKCGVYPKQGLHSCPMDLDLHTPGERRCNCCKKCTTECELY